MRLVQYGQDMAPSDEDLVAAFQSGDIPAFDQLVSRWDRRIQGVIYRLSGNHEEARD
jgi:RNA polymerase sigma-70 factor, ECF subfamily